MIKTGINLINEERQRQIDVEGWTAEHDAKYKDNDLFIAGCCYHAALRNRALGNEAYAVPIDWPWAGEWWKPSPDDRIKELKKAGALFKADYDLTGSELSLEMVKLCAKEINELLEQSDEELCLQLCESCEHDFDVTTMETDADSNWFCLECGKY